MAFWSNWFNKSRNNTPDTDLRKSEAVSPSRSIVEDPLTIISSMGYKDRPFSLSYDTLKRMAARNAVVASIITTRVNQISAFSRPARFSKDNVGYEIRLRDPKKSPDDKQRKIILAMELFLENCGYKYDPSRDSFDSFLRKIVRDSLTYDQLTFEIVPDRLDRPAEFYAVDAATIRAADVSEEIPDNKKLTQSRVNAAKIKWVQLINGAVTAEFDGKELAFAVRNPRTDILIQPYGFSELEQLIHQITAHLWAEEYNSKFFSQGGTTKGILNLKGANLQKEQLDSFRRQWTAQVSGMTGAWKTPVVSVEGLEYLNVSQSNRDMEYEVWMNYLINISSAVFQIDPAEINFPNRGGSGGSGGGIMEGGMESRLKNSKDKGLRPLLRFIEDTINNYIIYRFSKEYVFNFIGLDQETEHDRAELNEKLVRTRKTINEIRKENDDPPIDGGDIILDPTYTNYILQKEQAEQMEQQQQQGMGEEGDGEGQQQVDEYGNPLDEDGNPTGQDGKPLNEEEASEQQQDNQLSDSIQQKYS